MKSAPLWPSRGWSVVIDRSAGLLAILLAVGVPVVLVGGPFVATGGATAVALAGAALVPYDRISRPAAAGAPVAAVLTLAVGAVQREAALGVAPVLLVTLLVALDLVLVDAAESGDWGAVPRAVPVLLVGAGTALLVAMATHLQALPWFWLPVAGGVGAVVAYRFVVSGLRRTPPREPR